MNKIKLRAWLKEKEYKKGEMINVFDVQFKNSNGDISMINTKGLWRTGDEIDLLLYAGVYDKNKQEFCECDIVKFKCGLQSEELKEYYGKVIFRNGAFVIKAIGCVYKTTFLLYDLSACCDITWRDGDDFYIAKDFEIVGNIYQNLELWEGIKK